MPPCMFSIREAESDVAGMRVLGLTPGTQGVQLDYQIAAGAPLIVIDEFLTPPQTPNQFIWNAGRYLLSLIVAAADNLAFCVALFRADFNGNILQQLGSTPTPQSVSGASPVSPVAASFSIAAPELPGVETSVFRTTQTDPFTGGDSDPIGGAWAAILNSAFVQQVQVLSGAACLTSVGIGLAVILNNPDTWLDDQFSQASVKQLINGAGYLALVLRCDDAGENLYYIDLDASPGFGGIGLPTPLNVQKFVNGALQGPPYASLGHVTPQIGDVFRAEISGATITVFQNDIQVGQFTDSSPIASGSPGLLLQSTGMTSVSDVAWAAWSGGVLVPPASEFAVTDRLLVKLLVQNLDASGEHDFSIVAGPSGIVTPILVTQEFSSVPNCLRRNKQLGFQPRPGEGFGYFDQNGVDLVPNYED